MSGIAGVVRLGGTVADVELEAMLRPMAARGPDRQSLVCEGEVGFGQALLATTPEAQVERQPWRHPDSGCIVVSDSRLDNRPQLLRDLCIDRPADEVGDGELLHAAWQRWREDCVDRLRGDFAFALWNPAQRELFMARDPMGVRPFAFHSSPGLFVFGSVAEVVVAQGDVPRDLDEGRIADALIGETEGIDQSCTFYLAVERLPPAHWMRLRDGRLVRQRYWQPVSEDRPAGLPRDEREWIEAQREQLDRAVRLRLRSHRPVGSMLSGGLDSSSVVALAAIHHEWTGALPFQVFSAINSSDPDCAETRAIRTVVSHTRCAATLVDLPEFEHAHTRARRLWQEAGEPFDAPMSLVAALYEAAAGNGVASLMDGVPADNLYTVGRWAAHLFDQGHWWRAWQAAVTQWRVPWARFPQLHAMRVMVGCLLPERIHVLRDRLAEAREYRELLRTSVIDREFAEEAGLRQRYGRYRRTIGGSHQWHGSGDALSSLSAPYITAALERYNRVASLYGIEPRPPFADRDLIEFQAWIPMGLRIRDGHPKWVLRQAMARLLPSAVAWRRDKMHVGWRFSRVLFRDACTELESHFPGFFDEHWFDTARVAATRRDPDTGSGVGMPAALALQFWRKRTASLQAMRYGQV